MAPRLGIYCLLVASITSCVRGRVLGLPCGAPPLPAATIGPSGAHYTQEAGPALVEQDVNITNNVLRLGLLSCLATFIYGRLNILLTVSRRATTSVCNCTTGGLLNVMLLLFRVVLQPHKCTESVLYPCRVGHQHHGDTKHAASARLGYCTSPVKHLCSTVCIWFFELQPYE